MNLWPQNSKKMSSIIKPYLVLITRTDHWTIRRGKWLMIFNIGPNNWLIIILIWIKRWKTSTINPARCLMHVNVKYRKGHFVWGALISLSPMLKIFPRFYGEFQIYNFRIRDQTLKQFKSINTIRGPTNRNQYFWDNVC